MGLTLLKYPPFSPYLVKVDAGVIFKFIFCRAEFQLNKICPFPGILIIYIICIEKKNIVKYGITLFVFFFFFQLFGTTVEVFPEGKVCSFVVTVDKKKGCVVN